MSFEVKIDVFEGPFDLLLQLILKQELVIYEVPIAEITSAFMEHAEASPEIDLDTATEFLLIVNTAADKGAFLDQLRQRGGSTGRGK